MTLKTINPKRELLIAISVVIVIIGGLIGRLIIKGDIGNIITSIEKELINNKTVFDSINNWSDGQFGNKSKEKYPFIISGFRSDEICGVMNGTGNYIDIGETAFRKRIYHFFNKSSVEAINVYQDVIIYHLNYGTTTFINNKPYRIRYFLVYVKNKKTKRYKGYRLYKKGELPETKVKWLYKLGGNWYIKNHLPDY
jgi:hypothetical protein